MVNACSHCESPMSYRAVLCQKCANNTRIRAEYGIRTAADYGLGDDYVINALCFLHACGVLDSFIDRIEYWNDPAPVPALRAEDVISDSILNKYNVSYLRPILFPPFGWFRSQRRKR